MHLITRAGGATKPSIELHLSRGVFATGRPLSGVVVFRVPYPISIRSLTVSVTGCEKPSGASLARALRRGGPFFQREILLSGRDQPRLTSDRVSELWNAALGRDAGRTLSKGEHAYPFSIPLPASLPPSYHGAAGRIEYSVAAKAQFPAGGRLKVAVDVPLVFVPRELRPQPVALSYPTADGTVHASEIQVSLELEQRTVELGNSMAGRFTLKNPQGIEIPRITVTLERCEWVRLAEEKELHRDRVDLCTTTPDVPTASLIEGAFELRVPRSASPSVEGTSISVIWMLKLTLDTQPPLELKTPITVYAPASEW